MQLLPSMPPFSQPCWGRCDRVWTWLWLSGQDVPVSVHQYQGAACCYSDSETLHISCASWITVVSCCVSGVIDRNNSDCEEERLPFVCWTMMTNSYILQFLLCDCFRTHDVCMNTEGLMTEFQVFTVWYGIEWAFWWCTSVLLSPKSCTRFHTTR